MPTTSPAEMSNEELVACFGVEMWSAIEEEELVETDRYNELRTELLRRLNRAEGLEARLIAAVEQAQGYEDQEGVDVIFEWSALDAITDTFAAVREGGRDEQH